MSDAREIKTQDEISLLNHSAMMVDAAYHELYMAMKPGMRENEAVGLVAKRALRSRLRVRRGRQRDLRRALQPAPARVLRSDAAARRSGVLRRPPFLHGVSHLLLPLVRDRVGVARAERRLQALPRLPRRRRSSWFGPDGPPPRSPPSGRRREEFGFPNEEAAFALQMGHGIGLAIWEKPMISRLVSLEHPHEIKPGMVFALETFWPSKDGWSAARIEEEIVVTRDRSRGHHPIPGREAAGGGRHLRDGERTAADDARARGAAEQGGGRDDRRRREGRERRSNR